MYCSYCGSYVCEGDAFCANCGRRVDKKVPIKRKSFSGIAAKLLEYACALALFCWIAYGSLYLIMHSVINYIVIPAKGGISTGQYCSVPISNLTDFSFAYTDGVYDDMDIYFVDFSTDISLKQEMDISKLPVEGIGFAAPMLYEISGDSIHIWTDPESGYEDDYGRKVLMMDDYFEFEKEDRKIRIGDTWFYRYQ